MKPRTMFVLIARMLVASVWLYQGFWCKVLGREANHREIVASLPWFRAELAEALLLSVGIVEVFIAAWVLTGRRPLAAAVVQTLLLVAMNTGGLMWARAHIDDVDRMIAANALLLGVAWWLARNRNPSRLADSGASVSPTNRPVAQSRLDTTPWARGRLDDRDGSAELIFGWMYEDADIESLVFATFLQDEIPHYAQDDAKLRIFCIASAGDTAMTLAREGHEVYAVDINPAQIGYLRSRLDGAPARRGQTEQLLRRARQAAACLGLTPARIETFLRLDDPAEQAAYWREQMDRRVARLLVRALLHPVLLRRAYAADFVRSLPARFDAVMMRRLAAAFGNHPNNDNSSAWRLLLGRDLPAGPCRQSDGGHVHPVCADAVTFLRGCPTGFFDGFSLSNILDGAPPGYAAKLWDAVHHAAAPDAVSVLRTLRPASDKAAASWAARDRSLIWGGIEVNRVRLPDGNCSSATGSRSLVLVKELIHV